MFERFTHDARDVVHRAIDHARLLGHDWVGCEHLLLSIAGAEGTTGALLRDRGIGPRAVGEAIVAVIGPGAGDSDDKVALATLGIDLDQVRHTVEATFGSGALEAAADRRRGRLRRRLGRRRPSCATPTGSLAFSPRAKRCLELSLRQSLRLKHSSVGVEHIALTLLGRDDTAAWGVLLHLGADPAELRSVIEGSLRRSA